MLNNVKNIILKNKYAILVLLILSLWIRLMRGYNILLTYLILLVLYVVVGIGVQIILERFFPDWIKDEKNEKKDAAEKKAVPEPAPRRTGYERRVPSTIDKEYKAESFKRKEANQERTQPRTTSYTREVPNRRENNVPSSYGTSGYKKIERSVPVKAAPELKKMSPAPKVTSSYVRNAGGMSYGMEKKLVKTSANFDVIRRESDKFLSAERQRESLYSASRNSIVGKDRDLYTNKRETQSEAEEKVILEKQEKTVEYTDVKVEETAKAEQKTIENNSFDSVDDNYTETDYSKESEELKNEVEKRISDSKRSTRRPIKVLDYDETTYASYNEPVRRQNIHIPKSSVTPTTSNVNKNFVLGKQPPQQPTSTRKVHVATIETSDKVDADIDKINKLFDKDGNDEPKKGLFGRFKKKRR